jgi:urease accessory protein UreF
VLTHRIIERITKVFVLDRIEDEACAMTCLANLLAVANVEQYERLFAMVL